MPRATTATYVYAVLSGKKKTKKIGKAPAGLEDAEKPRLIDAGDGYSLVVSTVPLPAFSAKAIEKKLGDLDWVTNVGAAHEDVVEHAATLGTVVPMKLFTLFESDESAVSNLALRKKILDNVVERIADCEEWGLRILLDEEAADPKPKAAREMLANAKTEVDSLYANLEKASKRALKRVAPKRDLAGRVLLDAVFLVTRKGNAKFKKALMGTAQGLADDGFDVMLTGP